MFGHPDTDQFPGSNEHANGDLPDVHPDGDARDSSQPNAGAGIGNSDGHTDGDDHADAVVIP